MKWIDRIVKKFDLEDMKYVAYLGKRYKARLVLLVFIQFPLAAATVGMSFLIKNLIDAVSGKHSERMGLLVLLAVLIILSQALVQFFTGRLSVKTSTHIVSQMQMELFAHLQKMEFKHLQKKHTGEWMTLMTSDVTNVSGAITDLFPKFVGNLAMGAGALASAIWLYPAFSLVLLLLIPVALLYNRFYGRKQKILQMEAQEQDGKVRSFIQDALGIMSVIKTFGFYKGWLARLEALQQGRTQIITKRFTMSAIVRSLATTSAMLIFILVFFAGAGLVQSGILTLGTLIAFTQMISMLTTSFRGVFSNAGSFVNCFGSAHRLLAVMKLSEEAEGEPSELARPVGLRFKNVGFSYDNITEVLQDADFEIPAGSLVCIIGESGIGKSTIANLIVGLYTPGRGEVIFTSADKTQNAGADTRNLVAYVPQGNLLFAGSIRDNLLIGDIRATDEEIRNALEAADLGGFIDSLPQGLDTLIGEKAARVSMGQAQRMAIARAFLKKAPILLMDEPTSSLDPETEINILGRMKTEMPGTTKIIITHRRDALKFSDMVILVNGEGEVEVETKTVL